MKLSNEPMDRNKSVTNIAEFKGGEMGKLSRLIMVAAMLSCSTNASAFGLDSLYSAATAVKSIKSGAQWFSNAGALADYQKVYLDVTAFGDKSDAFMDSLSTEYSGVRAKYAEHNIHFPELVKLDADLSSISADQKGEVAVLRVMPRDSGILDKITDLTLDHSKLVALDVADRSKAIAEQDVEISSGLLTSFEEETQQMRGTILRYLVKGRMPG